MTVTIDPYAGFCFGVERAIRTAEDNLFGEEKLHSLGQIVHNEEENRRLAAMGIKTITHEDLVNLKQARVLFRAHGEPPASYKTACRNGTKVIDATCPVVRKLQSRVEKSHKEMTKKGGLLVIFGKKMHPEVLGLVGQTGNSALVITTTEEARSADLPPAVRLYAQTTMGTEAYEQVLQAMLERMNELHPDKEIDFKAFNTICGQVSGREKRVQKFAGEHQVILFVAGKNSSNGRHLFSLCETANPKSYYVSSVDDIRREWFAGHDDVGITGATSTPYWLMKDIADTVQKI